MTFPTLQEYRSVWLRLMVVEVKAMLVIDEIKKAVTQAIKRSNQIRRELRRQATEAEFFEPTVLALVFADDRYIPIDRKSVV